MPSGVEIHGQSLADIAKKYGSKPLKAAVYEAVSRSAANVRAELKRRVKEDWVLAPEEKDKIRVIRKPNRSQWPPVAVVGATGTRPISLHYLGAKQNRRGISVRVSKKSKRVQIRRAFMYGGGAAVSGFTGGGAGKGATKMPPGAYQRMGKRRLPITRLTRFALGTIIKKYIKDMKAYGAGRLQHHFLSRWKHERERMARKGGVVRV